MPLWLLSIQWKEAPLNPSHYERAEGNGVPSSRLKPYLVIAFLTLFYLYISVYMPGYVRVLMTGSAALVMLAIFKPDLRFWFPLLLIVAVLGQGSFSFGEFAPSPVTILSFLFYAVYVFRRVLWNDPHIPLVPPVKLALAALFCQAVSVFVSLHLHEQYFWNAIREGFNVYMMLPLMLIVADLYGDRENIVRLTKLLLLTLLLAALIGLVQQVSSTGFSRVDLSSGYLIKGRFSGTFGGPNIFSGFLELTVPIALAIALSVRSLKWRIIAYSAYGLGVISILYTFSRAGFMVAAISSIFLLVARFRKKLWVPLIAIVLSAGLIIAKRDTFNRQLSFLTNPRAVMIEPTLLHRYVTYKGYWHNFMERPVTGLGWGAQEFYWGRTKIYSFWEVRHARSTSRINSFGGLNSLFLNSAVKGGIPSIVALFLLGLAAITASVRAYRRSGSFIVLGIAAALGAYGMHQLVDNLLQWPKLSTIFWVEMGLLLCFARLSRKDRDKLSETFS